MGAMRIFMPDAWRCAEIACFNAVRPTHILTDMKKPPLIATDFMYFRISCRMRFSHIFDAQRAFFTFNIRMAYILKR